VNNQMLGPFAAFKKDRACTFDFNNLRFCHRQ
jgi:hypothetical protein